MTTFENLSAIFNKEKITVFRAVDIGAALQKGFLMSGISDFLRLIESANIQRVFIYEHYENVEDYYITEDILVKEARYENEKFLDYILPQIDEYNGKISKLDFSYPSWLAAICFCDNNIFFIICNNERTLNGKNLIEPEEMFSIIRTSNEEHKQKIKEENKNKVAVLREELRQLILIDKNFKLCTNQELRRDYAHKLHERLDEHFEPLKKIMYVDNFSILSREGRDFIELLWREIKAEKK